MIETIVPSSREEWLALRKSTIGASEAAALFGRSPWLTPYRLWAMKRGLLAPEEETPEMRRGRHMERLAVDFLREERPDWIIEHNAIPGGKFYMDRNAGISATPDTFVNDPQREGFGVVNIKSVGQWAFKKKWTQG